MENKKTVQNLHPSLKLFLMIAGIIFLIACESKKTSSTDKIAKALVIALQGGGSSSSSTPTFTCTSSSPAFSTLASAGTTTSCAKSGCHTGSSPQSGLDVSKYSSMVSLVTKGNASASYLYQKITTGSMLVNSTTQINQAVYCWIQGGANP